MVDEFQSTPGGYATPEQMAQARNLALALGKPHQVKNENWATGLERGLGYVVANQMMNRLGRQSAHQLNQATLPIREPGSYQGGIAPPSVAQPPATPPANGSGTSGGPPPSYFMQPDLQNSPVPGWEKSTAENDEHTDQTTAGNDAIIQNASLGGPTGAYGAAGGVANGASQNKLNRNLANQQVIAGLMGTGGNLSGGLIGPAKGGIDRSSFQNQLNPANILRLAALNKGEVLGNASQRAQQAQLESVFNRAGAIGKPLDWVTQDTGSPDGSRKRNPNGYYPRETINRGYGYYQQHPGAIEDFKKNILNPVMAGHDTFGEMGLPPMTGNASDNPRLGPKGMVRSNDIAKGWPYTDALRKEGGDTYFLEHPGARNLPRLPAAKPVQTQPFTAPGGMPPIGPSQNFSQNDMGQQPYQVASLGDVAPPTGGGGAPQAPQPKPMQLAASQGAPGVASGAPTVPSNQQPTGQNVPQRQRAIITPEQHRDVMFSEAPDWYKQSVHQQFLEQNQPIEGVDRYNRKTVTDPNSRRTMTITPIESQNYKLGDGVEIPSQFSNQTDSSGKPYREAVPFGPGNQGAPPPAPPQAPPAQQPLSGGNPVTQGRPIKTIPYGPNGPRSEATPPAGQNTRMASLETGDTMSDAGRPGLTAGPPTPLSAKPPAAPTPNTQTAQAGNLVPPGMIPKEVNDMWGYSQQMSAQRKGLEEKARQEAETAAAGPKATATEMGKTRAEWYENNARSPITEVPVMRQQIGIVRDALDHGAQTGFGGGMIKTLKQIATRITGGNEAAPLELFEKGANHLSLDSLRTLTKGTGQVRQFEGLMNKMANVNINTSRAANYALLDILDATLQRKTEISNFLLDRTQANGGTLPPDIERQVAKEFNDRPIMDEAIIDKHMKALDAEPKVDEKPEGGKGHPLNTLTPQQEQRRQELLQKQQGNPL